MPEKPKVRQQTNSQTQAGAAAQLIVNIFLVTAGDKTWVVKPIAFHVDDSARPLAHGTGGPSDGPTVDLEMEAGERSNAQGQGLTVTNEVNLLDILGRAIGAAAKDKDIQNALEERR